MNLLGIELTYLLIYGLIAKGDAPHLDMVWHTLPFPHLPSCSLPPPFPF